MRMPNSSPPSRAAVSSGRSTVPQTSRRLDEDLVAGRVPEGVVDGLERVQVEIQQRRPRAAPPGARRRACSSRSLKRIRLARPVSGSWRARARSSPSKASRSVTSRNVTTIPPTRSFARRSTTPTSRSRGGVDDERQAMVTPVPARSFAVRRSSRRSGRIVGLDEPRDGAADEARRLARHERGRRRRGIRDETAPVDDHDRVRGVAQDLLEALLAAQPLGQQARVLLGREVLADAHQHGHDDGPSHEDLLVDAAVLASRRATSPKTSAVAR